MSKLKQIATIIGRELEKYSFQEIADNRCQNEAQTRAYLIDPVLEVLGYDVIEDVIPEFDADFGSSTRMKVDYAITINSKDPIILIEAKKASLKLTDKHAGQLNNYFVNTSSAKIGVLTNGLIFKFYLTTSDGQNVLHHIPFLEFDTTNFSQIDVEELAKFHKSAIEPKALLNEADERVFIQSFENALFEEFKKPSEEFLKALFSRMASGKRMTSDRKEKMLELINPFSIKLAYDKLIEAELASGNSGIITTAEEKKAFHYIHAFFINSRGIDSDRIGFKDQKTKFSIVVDGNIRKSICSLRFSSSNKKIEINGVSYQIDKVEDVLKYKKELKESASMQFV